MLNNLWEALLFIALAILCAPILLLILGVAFLAIQIALFVFFVGTILSYIPGVIWQAGKILFK